MKESNILVWRADEYHKLSLAQDSAAKEFLKRLQVEKNAIIFDMSDVEMEKSLQSLRKMAKTARF